MSNNTVVPNIKNLANLDAMSDHEFIAAFEDLAGNKLFDPAPTAKYLVTEIQKRLGDRAISHRQRHLIIRDRLSNLSVMKVSTEMSKRDPEYIRFQELKRKALAIEREIRSILKSIEDYTPNSIKQRRGLKKSERMVKQLEGLQAEMGVIEAALSHSHTLLQEYVEKAEPLWKGVTGADSLIIKLKFSLAFVKFQSFGVRLIYLVLMFILAIIVDKYLPLTDRLFERVGTSQRHQLAVFLLFLIQALLFEPLFVRAKKRISWNIVRRMTKTARELLVKVEDYEQRLSWSEGDLSVLELEISKNK